MALSTYVTPAHVAVALGQPAPPTGGQIEKQWQSWIDDQLMFIQDRADKVDVTDISQKKIDYVIREVVVDQIKRRDQAEDFDIEDGSRFRTVADWYPLLGLVGKSAGAYAVDMVGAASPHLPWCSAMFGALYCSCGVDIAGTPIFEDGDAL